MRKAVKRVRSHGPSTPQIAEHVEQQLQSAYSEVLHEPIPARFLNVLDMLEMRTADAAPAKTRSPTHSKPAPLEGARLKI